MRTISGRDDSLKELEIAIRTTKFHRDEFPVDCGLPVEVADQIMDIIATHATAKPVAELIKVRIDGKGRYEEFALLDGLPATRRGHGSKSNPVIRVCSAQR